ncbi:hypothetical protein BsWGS_24365 [Bradybaena similaris]
MSQYIAAFVVGVFSASVMPVPVAKHNGDIVQVTVLVEESNPDHRARRTADSNLPDHLSCGFPFHKDNIVLRLKRSRLLPVVTSDAVNTDAINWIPQNSAVYTDPSAGSAMIVKRVNGQYNLEGSFFHQNKEWNLQPMSRLNGGHDNSKNESFHRIVPVNVKNTAISFANDVIMDTEDRAEQLYTHPLAQNGDRLHLTISNATTKGHRHKRATTQHIIEIAFIADFEDYSKWSGHVGTDNAVSAMRLWYTFTAESINIRYQTIRDPDFAISTTVTVLKILTNRNEATFISNLVNTNGAFRGSEGLNAFRKWYPKQPDIPLSDHYMLMTGFDVMGSSGIAIGSRLCTEFSLSICEDSFTGSLGGVAAHELGHSLSAVHDMETTGPNACSDKDQYVMSTVFSSPVPAGNEGNPWRFSPCSIKSFKAYLDGVTCTLPEHTSGSTELPVPSESDRAGQVLFRNAQCVLAFRDTRSSFCNSVQMQNGGLESLCGGMYCSIPNGWRGSCQTVIPQEFTSCGTKKWCVTGRCVDMEDPSTTTITTSATATTQSTSPVTEPLTSTTTTTTQGAAALTSSVSRENEPRISSTPAQSATIMKTTAEIPARSATGTTPTTEASIQLATTPLFTNTTSSGISDVSACNYLIYLKKGTEWWHCVQRALGRTEAAPRQIIRLPIRRGRVYIRRYRFYF